MGIHLIGLFFALFVQSDNAMHIAVDHTVHARVVCLPSFMVPQKQKNISRNKSRLQQSKDSGLTKSAEKQAAVPPKQAGTTIKQSPKIQKKQKQKLKKNNK